MKARYVAENEKGRTSKSRNYTGRNGKISSLAECIWMQRGPATPAVWQKRGDIEALGYLTLAKVRDSRRRISIDLIKFFPQGRLEYRMDTV
jgi:hypothetical protein